MDGWTGLGSECIIFVNLRWRQLLNKGQGENRVHFYLAVIQSNPALQTPALYGHLNVMDCLLCP